MKCIHTVRDNLEDSIVDVWEERCCGMRAAGD